MWPRNLTLCLLFSFFLLASVLLCVPAEAYGRDGKQKKQRTSSRRSRSDSTSKTYSSGTFDIRSFSARGDGMTDDSEALLAAWGAACLVESATILIPSEFMFLIRPLTLQGPCKPKLALQIDGVILGPSSSSGWPGSALQQWINVKWVKDFTIKGGGIVNGRGSAWWRRSTGTRPTAIRFYDSHGVVVQDITIQNSPQSHLKFDSSSGILVSKVRISSPENSPNTDGIHLQNTNNVEIEDCIIACGDDCISIQTGCSNVHIHGISCGPGHGISIGSLGIGGTLACVSNITVEDSSIHTATNGARIKTWAHGRGSLMGVSFNRISMSNVDMPIVIDQFYCDKNSCSGKSEGVSISGVTFSGITGTYGVRPVYLACNPKLPCTDITLSSIELSPSSGKSPGQPLCRNAYGYFTGKLNSHGIDACLGKSNRQYTAAALSHHRSQCTTI